jgi:predicted amidohydrolase
VSAARLAPGTLLLLPEMFATGFTMNAQAAAEPLDGATCRFLADLAERHGLWVQAGVVIGEADERPRSESLVFTPEGRLAARYAKMHLFSYAGEPHHFVAGDAPVAYAWEGMIVGPAICYDLRFPELFRRYVAHGAEVLAVIACWPAARAEHWLALLKARAIENQCYVAAVNRIGTDPSGLAYSGRSQIIDPRGVVLADGLDREGIIRAEVDLAALRRYRQEFPAVSDIRLRLT